jgi:hypothetical protein
MTGMRVAREVGSLAVLLVVGWAGLVGCGPFPTGDSRGTAEASHPSSAAPPQEQDGSTSGSVAPDTPPYAPEPSLTPEERERLLQELQRRKIWKPQPSPEAPR